MNWKDAPVDDCSIRSLTRFTDDRGWLAELFRKDELPAPGYPAMGYLSVTHPGIARGPHEHRYQTDLFIFFDGVVRLYLWDHRPDSPTCGHRQVIDLGAHNPSAVTVPPGVVHAYRNTGNQDAMILNFPNRLYAGEGKAGPVDEIRHEDQTNHHFVMD